MYTQTTPFARLSTAHVLLLSDPFSCSLMIKNGIWPLFAATAANGTPGRLHVAALLWQRHDALKQCF
jgi:hypothetical protein